MELYRKMSSVLRSILKYSYSHRTTRSADRNLSRSKMLGQDKLLSYNNCSPRMLKALNQGWLIRHLCKR